MRLRQRLKCLFCGCQIRKIPFQRLKELEEEIENAPNGAMIAVRGVEMENMDWVHKPKKTDKYTIGCDSKDAKDGAN